jgi:hypothetical protein
VKPPIIISEPGNIDLFRSVQEAERYLEPPDVENGRIIVHDSEGRRLSLEVVTEPNTTLFGIRINGIGTERIKIGSEESLPVHGNELKQLLIDFLVRVGTAPESFHNTTLEGVLDHAIQRCGFTR